jgi:hypothetical protein
MATLQDVQREAETRGFRWLARRAAEGPVVRSKMPAG